MEVHLTLADCEYLLECLKNTKHAYESTSYPTYDLKQEQLTKLETIQEKIRTIRNNVAN